MLIMPVITVITIITIITPEIRMGAEHVPRLFKVIQGGFFYQWHVRGDEWLVAGRGRGKPNLTEVIRG